MRGIAAVVFLLLAACSESADSTRKFAIGDCIANKYDVEKEKKNRDKWLQRAPEPRRVVEIGLDSYRLEHEPYELDYVRFDWECIFVKVQCGGLK